MPKLYIIGTGPGNPKLLTMAAREAIEACDVLLGAPRLLEAYREAHHMAIGCSIEEIKELIEQQNSEAKIGVLASGDVGFYSIAKMIENKLGAAYEIELISGISSMQYFCSQIHEAYDSVYPMSMHGRDNHLVGKVLTHHKVFTLTGGKYPAHEICKLLVRAGLGNVLVTVGENLSYDNEKIVKGSAEELSWEQFTDLAVMIIENPDYRSRDVITPGISDDSFIRGKVPMTKQEVRVVSLAKLQIKAADIIYDIGAGTGSVAIEIALQAREGKVYAIERNPEGIELIHQNIRQFGVQNIEVIETYFPEKMELLPVPDKVFIGGSGGNLEEIIDKLLELNPEVRIIINAITLETLGQVVNSAKRHQMTLDMTQLYTSNSKKVGTYHMMIGQNPIFIITMGGKKDEK